MPAPAHLQPLGSYVSDLIDRITMFNDWLSKGPPAVFWISGFYFTHAFLTGELAGIGRYGCVPCLIRMATTSRTRQLTCLPCNL